MNRKIRGVAGLLVALGASACASDYGLDFETNPTQIQASPEVMFITSGAAAKELLLRLTNDINQSVPTTFTVSNVPAGLTVTHDDNYRPDYVNSDGTLQQPGELVQQRYYVSANMPTGGQVSFTVSSGGFSKDITVRVLPTDLGAALSATAPALGDEVTISAPANLSFTSASTVTFTPGGAAVITNRTAKSISFLPRPGSTGKASVTNVTLDYAPTLAPRTLTTASEISVPAVSAAPTTLSSAAPAQGATVTVTLTGGFKFLGNSTVTIGGKKAAIIAKSADSTSATVVPMFSSTGAVAYTNVALGFLLDVPLSLPSDGKSITVSGTFGGTSLAGGTDISNAPTITLPSAAGLSAIVTDMGSYGTYGTCLSTLGGDSCRIYKIVVPATQSYEVSMEYQGNLADLGLYRLTSAGAFAATVADAHGQGSGAAPEDGNMNSLAAGTYYLAVTYYGAGSYGGGAQPLPTFVQIRLTRTS